MKRNKLNEAIFMASPAFKAPMQNMERRPSDTASLVEEWMKSSKFSHMREDEDEDEEVEFETIENFPEWAVNYAYYGRDENLSDDEKKEVDDFLADYGVSTIKSVIEDSYNSYSSRDAIKGQGGATYTVLI